MSAPRALTWFVLALAGCKEAVPGPGATAVRLRVAYEDGRGLNALEVSARERMAVVVREGR